MWTAGFRSMLLWKCLGGRTWPLRLKGAGPGEKGGTYSIRSFWLLETSFHAFIYGCVLSSCFWFLTLTLDCQMANEIIILVFTVLVPV